MFGSSLTSGDGRRLRGRILRPGIAALSLLTGLALGTIAVSLSAGPQHLAAGWALTFGAIAGIGKRAAPWGINAAVTLTAPSSGRGRVIYGLAMTAAHVVPAVLLWSIAGLVLSFTPQPVALVIAIGYGLVHGSAETLDLPLRPPGVDWQVPSTWLRGRSDRVRILIWGATLGPGIATRNPYAGMWFVPILLAALTTPILAAVVGALVGLVHGTARAVGVLANQQHQHSPTLPWRMMITQMRFRHADGVALLLAVACLAVVAI